MGIHAADGKSLRRYLLGDLSAREEEEFELWLLSEEKAYDVLEAAEDDLTDEYLAGDLKTAEIEKFEEHFLSAPERVRKLQFSRSLKRYIENSPEVSLQKERTAPFWQTAADFIRCRPAFSYAVAGVMAILLVGWCWSFLRVAQLERQLNTAAAQLSYSQQARVESRSRLGESRAVQTMLQAQLQTLEKEIAARKIAAGGATPVALTLNPGILRSSNGIPSATILPADSQLQFRLVLLDDNYERYRVGVFNANGEELWMQSQLPATATAHGKSVILTVPGVIFSTGDFNFMLAGLSDSRTPESINSYHFRIFRQKK